MQSEGGRRSRGTGHPGPYPRPHQGRPPRCPVLLGQEVPLGIPRCVNRGHQLPTSCHSLSRGPLPSSGQPDPTAGQRDICAVTGVSLAPVHSPAGHIRGHPTSGHGLAAPVVGA